MRILVNKKAFTLIETVIAVTFTVILMTVIGSFYNTTRVVNASGTAGQMLQDGSNLILSKIIEGKTESIVINNNVVPTIYRLSEAVQYCIGTGAWPCAGSASIAELHFKGTDGVECWYKLNSTSTQLIYCYPTSITNGVATSYTNEVIYTAPINATLTLRFWIPTVANYPASVVGVDAALTQNVLGRAVAGSSSTIVHLRNHP